MGVIKSISN